jgi:hypothetical protein
VIVNMHGRTTININFTAELNTDNGLSLILLSCFPLNTPNLLNSFPERLTGSSSHSQNIDCEMTATLDCSRN